MSRRPSQTNDAIAALRGIGIPRSAFRVRTPRTKFREYGTTRIFLRTREAVRIAAEKAEALRASGYSTMIYYADGGERLVTVIVEPEFEARIRTYGKPPSG